MQNTPEKNSNGIQRARRGGARPGAGRPKGRRDSKTIEIIEAAKKYAGDALRALVHVAKKGKSDAARVMAATALLDRGYGRPKQALEHSGPDGRPIAHEVGVDELRTRLAGRVAGLATRMGTNGHHPGTNGNGTHRP